MFTLVTLRAQELCQSRRGCPGLLVPNSPSGLRGRKNKTKQNSIELNDSSELWSCVKVEVGVRNCPYCLCVRKATLNSATAPLVSRFGLAIRLLYAGETSVPFRFGSFLSSNVTVCGHCQSCDFVPSQLLMKH